MKINQEKQQKTVSVLHQHKEKTFSLQAFSLQALRNMIKKIRKSLPYALCLSTLAGGFVHAKEVPYAPCAGIKGFEAANCDSRVDYDPKTCQPIITNVCSGDRATSSTMYRVGGLPYDFLNTLNEVPTVLSEKIAMHRTIYPVGSHARQITEAYYDVHGGLRGYDEYEIPIPSSYLLLQ